MAVLLVGTYTTACQGKGIYQVYADEMNSVLSEPELIIETRDPSYLLVNEKGLYWVDEAIGEPTGRLCFARREGKRFIPVQSLETMGENPCHLALSPDGKTMAVANYTSGSVTMFDVLDSGGFERREVIPGRHGSADPLRQEGPHAHFVFFDRNDVLYCADLGADEIRCIRRQDGAWRQDEAPAVQLDAGEGPRHFVKYGDTWYIVTEMGRHLVRKTPEGMEKWPLTADDLPGTGAALKADGHVFYTTQRGADTVSVFTDMNGRMVCEGPFPAGGKTPRDCLHVMESIFCACQDSGEVTALHLEDRYNNTWVFNDRVSIPGAVCVVEDRYSWY